MGPKQEFAEKAREGLVLARRCSRCGRLHLATAYFCQGCGSGGFEGAALRGSGRVETYTIITVPPAGFEEHAPYAWVVLGLDGCDLRISGFMAGVSAPSDLPVGSRARVAGFDGRGIVLERIPGGAPGAGP